LQTVTGRAFFAHLNGDPHVYFYGQHQVASVQVIDFLDICKPGPAAKQSD